MEIDAIGDYQNNAELIEACAQLGYLKTHWFTVDPTYGLGKFWTKWAPKELWASDLNRQKSPQSYPVDARSLPFDNGSVDAVVLDPPYKLNGRSSSGGPAESDSSYGVDGAYIPWQDRHSLVCEMLTEAARIVRERGTVLLKCQNQVCSGKIRWQTWEFAEYAEQQCDLRLVDELMLVGKRKQPSDSQVHARRNYSSLLVFRKSDGTWRRKPKTVQLGDAVMKEPEVTM